MATKKEKLPSTPLNYEAEQAMLGCLLMDANIANEYTILLNETDFAMSQNKIIFNAILALNNESKPIDTLTVADRLTINNEMEKAGGMEYLSKLVTSIPSTANSQHYFDILKRDSMLREVIGAGNKISKFGMSADSGMDALDFAERTVFEISEHNESSRLMHIMDASSKVYNKIKSIQLGEFEDDGIATGFDNVDDIIGSMKPGALCILAARPSVGKTAFSLSIAANAAIKYNKSIAIFSLEMPTEQLVQRMMTTLSGVPFSKQMNRHKMNISDTGRLFKAHQALGESRIYVDDSPNNKPGDIISKCRRMKNAEGIGLDLVIIDYLQLMTLENKTRVESRQQEVSNMSRLMKIYAKELGVPFLVLSQMSRAAEQRGEEPMLSDLRESGSIEQDADIVMFLHRPKIKENAKSKESVFIQNYNGNIIKMLVLKNRNGKIGNAFFDWKGDNQLFTPIKILDETEAPKPKVEENPVHNKMPEHISGSMEDDPMADLKEIKNNDIENKNTNDSLKEYKSNLNDLGFENDEVEEYDDAIVESGVDADEYGVQEPPFDTSDDKEFFGNNESGFQENEGDLDY